MKRVNPKYACVNGWWHPLTKEAGRRRLQPYQRSQAVLNNPYEEQSPEIEAMFDRLRPKEFFDVGGISLQLFILKE